MTNPYYGTGGTLRGIAGLLEGINALRDPKAAERARLQDLFQQKPEILEQYRQQYQDNPDALQALLGSKPRFGGSNYSQLESLITSKSTNPEVLARQAKAQADLQDSKNRLQQSTRLGNIIQRGQQEEDVNRNLPVDQYGNAQARLTAPGQMEVPISQLTPGDRQKYQESQTNEGIRTPQQREVTSTQIAGNKASIKASEANTAESTFKLTEAKDKVAREDENRLLAQTAIARTGKKNLYEAGLNGNISEKEKVALMAVPEYKELYNNHQADYWAKKNNEIAQGHLDLARENGKTVRAQATEAKYLTYAMHLSDRAMQAGVQLSVDDALKFAKAPSDVLESNDPGLAAVKSIMQDIQNKELKKQLPALKSSFLSATSKLRAQLSQPGVEPTQEDVNEYNEASKLAWAGSSFAPPVFKLATGSKPGRLWGTNATHSIKIESIDPRLSKIMGDVAPIETEAEKKSGNVDLTGKEYSPDVMKAVKMATDAKMTPQDLASQLTQHNVPDSTKAQILEAYSGGKQSKDSTTIKPDTSGVTGGASTYTPPVPIQGDTAIGRSGRTPLTNTQPDTSKVPIPAATGRLPSGPFNRDTTGSPINNPGTTPPKQDRSAAYKTMLTNAKSAGEVATAAQALLATGLSYEEIQQIVPEKYRANLRAILR